MAYRTGYKVYVPTVTIKYGIYIRNAFTSPEAILWKGIGYKGWPKTRIWYIKS